MNRLHARAKGFCLGAQDVVGICLLDLDVPTIAAQFSGVYFTP